MKKSLTLVLAAVFAVALFTGCKPKEETMSTPETTTEAPAVVEETGTAMTGTETMATETPTAPTPATETPQ